MRNTDKLSVISYIIIGLVDVDNKSHHFPLCSKAVFAWHHTPHLSLHCTHGMKAAFGLAKYRAAASRINSEPDLGYVKKLTSSTEHLFCLLMHGTTDITELWITFTWAFLFQVCREPCQLHAGCLTFLKLFFKFNCPFVIIKQALIGWPWSCVQFQVTWDTTMTDQKIFEVPYVVYRTKNKQRSLLSIPWIIYRKPRSLTRFRNKSEDILI